MKCPRCGKLLHYKIGPDDNLIVKCYGCGFMDWIKERDKDKWIYESSDGGKTIYRRKFGDYDNRELV